MPTLLGQRKLWLGVLKYKYMKLFYQGIDTEKGFFSSRTGDSA